MPLVEEVFESIGTSVVVTTLDLASGYWQIPMDTKSRDNTAFTTPFGLFEFEVMPFGLHSTSAKFQRMITHVIRDCQQFSCAYLDNASVFSKNWEEHCARLQQVFSRLHIAGLTLKLRKCRFEGTQVPYLGHIIGGGIIQPDPTKCKLLGSSPDL